MGTNYYIEDEKCPHCGRSGERLHIGKSSAGWCFSLHVDDDRKSLDDWVATWFKPGAVITDEYGKPLTPGEMLSVIAKRGPMDLEKKPIGYSGWADFHSKNGSEPGPNGMLRSRIGPHCVGHGSGTWDLIPGPQNDGGW